MLIMGKKTGRKVSYELYGGEEVKELIGGKTYGVKLDKTTKNYYAMLPTHTGTKRKWLGSDLAVAVAKFTAMITKLKGEQEQFATVTTEVFASAPMGSYDLETGEYHGAKVSVQIKESEHIEWLKKELQDPKALAKKTGLEFFAQIDRLMIKEDDIPLKDLLTNYLNKKKTISKVEEQQSKRFFNEFIKEIDCKYVDEISLKDIIAYEDYLHSLDLSPKSITNKMNKVSTIINYNLGRYENTHLQQVRNWLKGLDRPESDKPFNPSLMSLENFNKLYEVSDIKWKLWLLLGLNCAMYPTDIANLKMENIDIEAGTIFYRRSKTGKVLAVSTLWKRTHKLLKQYIETERTGKSKYVFISRLGENYSPKGITEQFRRTVRKNAGLDKSVNFNHLRDTFATLGQDLGYSQEQVNLVLGHSTGINDRYAVRNASKLTKDICEGVEKEFYKK